MVSQQSNNVLLFHVTSLLVYIVDFLLTNLSSFDLVIVNFIDIKISTCVCYHTAALLYITFC